MAKFHGYIGFAVTSETSPGVYTESTTEREYFGDIIKNTRRIQNGVGINDNIVINNQVSVISDEYINNFIGHIRYVKFGPANTKWKVDSIDPGYPRITLTLGGLYNG